MILKLIFFLAFLHKWRCSQCRSYLESKCGFPIKYIKSEIMERLILIYKSSDTYPFYLVFLNLVSNFFIYLYFMVSFFSGVKFLIEDFILVKNYWESVEACEFICFVFYMDSFLRETFNSRWNFFLCLRENCVGNNWATS